MSELTQFWLRWRRAWPQQVHNLAHAAITLTSPFLIIQEHNPAHHEVFVSVFVDEQSDHNGEKAPFSQHVTSHIFHTHHKSPTPNWQQLDAFQPLKVYVLSGLIELHAPFHRLLDCPVLIHEAQLFLQPDESLFRSR